MKKILSSLLAGVMACVLAVACFACNAGDQSDNKTEYFNEYNMYLVYAASENITPLDYKTWLATVKGEKGDKGEDGKSAYQIWLDNGNTGSQADFLEWLKGEQGAKGEDGKSAYQIWLDNGNTGSQTDFLEWLKGEKDTSDGVIEKKYIYFGSYPQTHISDETLITELNKLTKTNVRGYYSYNGKEYAKITVGEGVGGSYTDKYGNIAYSSYSDGVKISQGVAWFGIEDIKWRILEENEGFVKVLSTVILDRSCYYKNGYYRNINGVDIAPNNYKYSTLREFLNNGFYNAAFTSEQKKAIITTYVDNSANTTLDSSNIFACENTSDKVFALSCSEASMYLLNKVERRLMVTDYAKAIGVDLNEGRFGNLGYWWLRSPSEEEHAVSYLVDRGGNVKDENWFLYADRLGVVPAMQIRIA